MVLLWSWIHSLFDHQSRGREWQSTPGPVHRRSHLEKIETSRKFINTITTQDTNQYTLYISCIAKTRCLAWCTLEKNATGSPWGMVQTCFCQHSALQFTFPSIKIWRSIFSYCSPSVVWALRIRLLNIIIIFPPVYNLDTPTLATNNYHKVTHCTNDLKFMLWTHVVGRCHLYLFYLHFHQM